MRNGWVEWEVKSREARVKYLVEQRNSFTQFILEVLEILISTRKPACKTKKENILHASCLESKGIWERFHKPVDRGYYTDSPRCKPRLRPPLKKERYQSCLSLLTFTRQCWYQIQKDKKEKVKLKYWVNGQPTVID